jgi:hypothetical protein
MHRNVCVKLRTIKSYKSIVYFHVIFTVHFDSVSSITINKCTFCISVTLFTLHMFRLWSCHHHGTLVGSLHWL